MPPLKVNGQLKLAYIQLHIAVFLFGFTAILGKLIELPELAIVWWRLVITCISILFIPNIISEVRKLSPKFALQLAGIGVLVTIHWVTFYGAIKYANVSIALVCLATTSFFTSILEPLIVKTRFKWHEFILGLLIIPGMFLIVNNVQSYFLKGIWFGLISALFAALFSIFNKTIVHKAPPMGITLIELSSGAAILTLLLPFYSSLYPNQSFLPSQSDWFYLILLALLCTTLAYVLSLKALKYISAFTSNLTINLEPVYGIILAFLLFREDKDLGSYFYIGTAIILFVVFLHPFLRKR